MNVLCVSMDNTPYADRSVEVKVAEQLVEMGHDVHLLVEREPAWPDDVEPPSGLSWQVEPVNETDHAREVAARVDVEGAEVALATSISGAPILAHYQDLHPGVATVCQVLDVPLWRLEWGDQAPWYRGWAPWFSSALQMDRLIVNTERCVRDLGRAAGLYGATEEVPEVDLVYYGVDTAAADAADPVDPVPDEEFPALVGTVSRMAFYKGYALGAMAVSMFPEDEKPGYVVVGDGEDRDRLVQEAQLAGASLVLTGGIPDRQKFETIKALDAAVYPGYNPSIGSLFPLEAVYCGVPVVTWDLDVHAERFEKYHYAVPRFDVAELQATLAAVIDRDEVSVYDPEAARAWIREERSVESHARGVSESLEAAVEGADEVASGPSRGQVTEEGLVIRGAEEE